MGIYNELSELESSSPQKSASSTGSTSPKPQTPTPPPSRTPRRHDVTDDVTTSLLAGVDLAGWREIISETETHNSALRLSAKERDAVEDLVRDLRRKKRIKTSMNELVRLGLLVLLHDFAERKEQSIVYRVKKS